MAEQYEIHVMGHLDDSWESEFGGLLVSRLINGETLLSGSLPDQAALHGVIERIRDLNLTLLSVVRISQEVTE